VIILKIVGIIVEYNPLHNGHLYHFNKIKELSNANIVVAIMSSSFTMRGDLSLFDKFTKAKQAINLGIDIVLENPFLYTVNRADIYAKNCVDFLNLLNVCEIWIGSELNDVNIYKEYLDSFNNNKIKENQIDGISYKTASLNELPFKSNDILGFFYYKHIIDNNYNIILKTIKREGNDYLDNEISSIYPSAKAIRCNLDKIDLYTPKFVYNNKDKILDENKLFKFIKYKIISSDKLYLKNIFLVDEGIENRLKDIYKFDDYNSFLEYMISKRYTKTRIKRMLLNILFDVTKDINNNLSKIDFVRILDFNDIGRSYLNKIKKNVKIYTNIKEGINNIFDTELKISKILDLIYNIDLFKQEQGQKKESN